VEGHLLIGIRRSAHVPRICMEESVVAEAVPKRPRYGLDIAQRARLRLRHGFEFIVLVLAGNEVGRHAPPSPGIVRQILAEVSAQGETAVAPIGVLLTVLRRCHKEPAIQRNQPIGEEFQATRHRSSVQADKAPAWGPAESNYRGSHRESWSSNNSNCMAKYYSREVEFP